MTIGVRLIGPRGIAACRASISWIDLGPGIGVLMTTCFFIGSLVLLARAPAVRVPVRLGFDLVVEMHMLRLAEGVQTLDAELAADPGHPHAAERPASLSVSGSLIQNVPAWMFSMAYIACSRLLVKMLAPRP